MFGTHDLLLFVASGLLLNLVPGPDTFLVMSRSAAHGWRLGSAASLGIGTGVFVHVLAAALGLSALLATSAAAFTVVKWVGAAYLVYLGLGMLWTTFRTGGRKAAVVDDRSVRSVTWRQVYVQGFVTNVLNPKVALFFLAFVPQFIAADAPSTTLAFVFLGTVFNFNSMVWCHALAVVAAAAGRRLRAPAAVTTWLNRCVGGLFVLFGWRLALAQR